MFCVKQKNCVLCFLDSARKFRFRYFSPFFPLLVFDSEFARRATFTQTGSGAIFSVKMEVFRGFSSLDSTILGNIFFS